MKLLHEDIRDSLVQAGQQACGYMNCKLFVQTVTGIPKLDALPTRPFVSETDLAPGDVLKWGMGTHWAIYIGDGDIMEVEEWGAESRIVSLAEVLEEMDPPDTVFSTAGYQHESLLRKYIRGLLNEENVLATGMCFPFAYQKAEEWFEKYFTPGGRGRKPKKHPNLNDKSKFKVVHGTVTDKWKKPPKPVVHGWVEMGNLVFDDQTRMTKPNGVDKEAVEEFTAEEAIMKCVWEGGEGPWNKELLDVIVDERGPSDRPGEYSLDFGENIGTYHYRHDEGKIKKITKKQLRRIIREAIQKINKSRIAESYGQTGYGSMEEFGPDYDAWPEEERFEPIRLSYTNPQTGEEVVKDLRDEDLADIAFARMFDLDPDIKYSVDDLDELEFAAGRPWEHN